MSSRNFKISLLLVIAFLSIVIFLIWNLYPEPKLEVNFLDVGQGDATLIESPYGQNILIDGGPNKKILSELSRALPWWDKNLDLIILTHPHSDHVDGLINVLKSYNTKKILYTGVNYASADYQAFKNLAQEKNINLMIIKNPQTITLGENCALNILYPFESLENKVIKNLNNSSIISKLDCEGKKFLLAGDAEKEIEEKLLARNLNLKSDIVKASHHGSKTSNTLNFLKTINPEIIIISVGENNTYHHPSPNILENFKKLKINFYRTDEKGTITFQVLAGRMQIN